MNQIFDAIIIGAGISGITLAQRLQEQHKTVLLLEKSSGVGGRIATRRAEDCIFDHGAQFIKKVHTDLNPYWSRLNCEKDGHIWFSSEETQFYTFKKGMTQLPKALTRNLEVRLREKVIQISNPQRHHCVVRTEHGMEYNCKRIYLTSPLPQSLQLLRDSQISYPSDLEEILYAPALVGLFRVETKDENIIGLNYHENPSQEIYTISNQLSKAVSPNLAFTVTMQPTWSDENFSGEDSDTLAKISTLFKDFLNQLGSPDSYSIPHSQLKKWRYSHPLKVSPKAFQTLGDENQIVLLGDAFGGGSIPGAVRSAWSVSI